MREEQWKVREWSSVIRDYAAMSIAWRLKVGLERASQGRMFFLVLFHSLVWTQLQDFTLVDPLEEIHAT